MAAKTFSSSSLQSDDLKTLLSEIRRDLQQLNETNLLNEQQVDRLQCFLTSPSYEFTQQDEVTTTASEENPDIDEVFEEVRGKLLQLRKVEICNEQLSKEVARLKKEKDHAIQVLEKTKFANQELQVQVDVVSVTLTESQQRNETLKKQNDLLTTELNKLSLAHQKLQTDYNEMQRKHQSILEKMDAWYKVHQDVSTKQSQNQSKMMDLAMQIGQAKATTLYLHQLKHQVEVTFKSSLEALTRLQNSKETDASAERTHVPSTSSCPRNVAGCSSSNAANVRRITVGSPRKNVTELVKNELDGYKEELLKSLLVLSNLGGTGSASK